VAAGPSVPVDDEPPGQGPGSEGGEQPLDSGMVSGIMPGSAGGGWPGLSGGGAWVSVRFLSWAAVMAQMAPAAHSVSAVPARRLS
jgi:hypothetical protein